MLLGSDFSLLLISMDLSPIYFKSPFTILDTFVNRLKSIF